MTTWNRVSTTSEYGFVSGVLAFALFLVISLFLPIQPARAQTTCAVPNQITNGQVADATVVMNNFNGLKDCVNSVSNAAVMPSGTPAAGNLPVFSGPKTITGGNLLGDCTTSGSLAVTCTKANGTPFGPFATGTDAGQLTGTISVNRFNNGVNAANTTFLRGDGNWAVPGTGGGGSGVSSFSKLAVSTLTVNGTTISFSNIDQSYTDLVLVIYPKLAGNSANNTVSMVINGDTGNNYDWTLWSRFEGQTTFNASAAQLAWAGYQSIGNGTIEIELFDYTDTTMSEKNIRASSTAQGGGNYFRRNFDAKWHPTTMAAVTTITIVCSTNFLAGTHAILYGRG